MSGITFGSVGDIIAVGQIAWSLAKALSDSRGSAKEYQGLAKELETFDKVLLQVVALWQNYDDSPELNELGTITKDVEKEWKDTLGEFRSKVDKKYGKSLCPGGSGSWFKDASKKVLWRSEKEDIGELRRKLKNTSDKLSVLILAAIGKSEKLAAHKQAFRVEAVHCHLQEAIRIAEEQVSKLKVIDEKIESQGKKTDLMLSTVRSGVTSLTHVQSIIVDIRAILGLFQTHISALQATPRGLGTHWQQAPVTLEDALGNMIPLPLELVNSWDMFDMILSERFKKHPGHRKVKKGEFAIEQDTTGRELSRSWDWSMQVGAGQKIDMSMIFSGVDDISNHCPRCRTESAASAETRTQCTNTACKMWFQRVEEVAVPESTFTAPPVTASRPVEDATKIPASPTGLSVHPGDFQRVRLMTNLRLKELGETEIERISQNAELREHQHREYKRRVEVDLRKQGLDERRIEQVMETMSAVDSNGPKYPRMARRRLSIETLNQYKIDCEYDKVESDTQIESQEAQATRRLYEFAMRQTDAPGHKRTRTGRSNQMSPIIGENTYEDGQRLPPIRSNTLSSVDSMSAHSREIRERHASPTEYAADREDNKAHNKSDSSINETESLDPNDSVSVQAMEVDGSSEDDDKLSVQGSKVIDSTTQSEVSARPYLSQLYEGSEAVMVGEDVEGNLTLPLSDPTRRERTSADFWIPQATPDGRLFYFNIETGESSAELPLESPSSETKTRDTLESVKSNQNEERMLSVDRRQSEYLTDLEEEDHSIAGDRWAQIRKNAADRMAQTLGEESSGGGQNTNSDDEESSGEETIESRVARIRARVAELTGTMKTASRPEWRFPSREERPRPHLHEMRSDYDDSDIGYGI